MIEAPIYGSSRLGSNIDELEEIIPLSCSGCGNQLLTHANRVITPTNYKADSLNFSRLLGKRRYEQSNHLGNVLTTISDRKIQEDGSTDGGTVGEVDYYMPDVLSAQMFYPYGMVLPSHGTAYNTAGTFGFQGQLKDNEMYNVEGASINFSFRMQSTRAGRFLSTDPLFATYPHNSSYAFSENRVIDAVELEGLESHPLFNGEILYGPWTEKGAGELAAQKNTAVVPLESRDIAVLVQLKEVEIMGTGNKVELKTAYDFDEGWLEESEALDNTGFIREDGGSINKATGKILNQTVFGAIDDAIVTARNEGVTSINFFIRTAEILLSTRGGKGPKKPIMKKAHKRNRIKSESEIEKAQNQLEGIEKAQSAAKKAKKGQKQNAIFETKKSKQKFKNSIKNVRSKEDLD